MDFGVFDHLDRYGTPLQQYYEERLKLIEEYDRAGFYAYHLAEHHSTPLGMAASPSVFLAAVAQRTRRLRFGPLVYALPLYHPLRIIEEICMLDQMSGGRLEVGFGRGASPVELSYFGQNPEQAQNVYAEGLQLVIKGLTSKSLSFSGEYFNFKDVRMELEPLQKPHPPIWYGVHSPDSAERAARSGLNTVSLDPVDEARFSTGRYRTVWHQLHGDAPLPKVGLGRFVVLDNSDHKAVQLARRAYAKWHDSFTFLSRLTGRPQTYPRPDNFDEIMRLGQGIAGSAKTVTEVLRNQLAETNANYLVCQFAFGDLNFDEAKNSVGIFVDKVMPVLRGN
jgi:alkanesulfonate monooxygenase SsuD/methylene tetrahydromethanopterin reductase-like flavin-dependent oxidoreductase (luciferase family)